MLKKLGFACPCCRYMTLSQRSVYEICKVCFWEDDGIEDLDFPSGPNHVTLAEGRTNFAEFGACQREVLRYVEKDGPQNYERQIDGSE